MDIDFINCFVVSTADVLKEFTTIRSFQKGKIAGEIIRNSIDEVNVKVGIKGMIEGAAVFCCDQESALKIVSDMVEEKITELTDYVSDALGELGNIITGKASNLLDARGYNSRLTVPELVVGVGVELFPEPVSVINIPIVSSLGVLNVKIGLDATEAAAEFGGNSKLLKKKDATPILMADHSLFLTGECAKALRRQGHNILTVSSAQECIETYNRELPSLVFVNSRLPGLDIKVIIEEIRRINSDAKIIILAKYKDIKQTGDLLKQGARYYIELPSKIEEIVMVTEKYLPD